MRVGLLVLLASSAVAHASAGIEATPSAIDFGPVDVAGPAAVRSVTLTNNGVVALDVDAPACGGAFVATGSPAHLLAGASTTTTVAYLPTGEQTDTGTISFAVAGGSPIVIGVQGRGIDRHVSVAPPAVAQAFRNAGAAAPVVAVTVMNTGEANLAITSASVTGAPIWTLVDEAPVDIPGRSSFDFHVRFAPDALGPAPVGHLLLGDNDAARAMADVQLAGIGVARDVTLGPDLDLGYVAVGTTLDGDAQIVNLDGAHDFSIAHVDSSDPAFAIDAPGAVAAGATVPLHVTFAADVPGDFTTTATLYLDEDPQPADTVTLHAHSMFVDAQGGGGCSTSGGSGPGMLVIVAAMLVTRRRRGALLVLLSAGVAGADPARNVDISVFDPTPTTATSGFQLAAPALGARGDIVVSALLSYASNPLVLASPQLDDVAIANRATLVLGAAWAVRDRLELGAHVPMFVQDGDANDPQMGAGTPGVRGDGIGNLTLHAKAQLAPELAALALVTLPTASADRFAGEDAWSARLLAVAALPVTPRVRALFNFGAVLRPEAQFASYSERSGLAWGTGAAYDLSATLSLSGEVFGELVPGGQRDAMNRGELLATTEALIGAHDRIDPRFVVGVAIGRGVIAGPGAPAFRGIVTVTYQPTAEHDVHVAKVVVGTRPPPSSLFGRDALLPGAAQAASPPLVDRDRDGIPDARDACPDKPETINGIDDDDGCPDAGDGLVLVSPDELELRTPIQFSGTAIDPASANELGQVGAMLRAHGEIRHLRIAVHVQPTANADADLALSKRRAQAVRDWLVQWGIAVERLDAKGFGGMHPIADPDDPDAAATNERVELLILDR